MGCIHSVGAIPIAVFTPSWTDDVWHSPYRREYCDLSDERLHRVLWVILLHMTSSFYIYQNNLFGMYKSRAFFPTDTKHGYDMSPHLNFFFSLIL
ncbi:hypothetical protein PBPRC0002 (plasmid) [Photobacterium profundum SS9]|uniref:Uncharacterized protein n=1 Tax=Photobacterium profundum (strain SS9) TaxID=298386 RepID=Q6LW95_PHOPR|nr:hypothetical protein PBPRC0002 [Photobacterium profundum SS9]